MKLNNLKLYAILDKSTDSIGSVFISSDNVAAGGYMVQNFRAIYKDLPNGVKKDFMARVHDSALVVIGELDLLAKKVNNDYNVVCDFFDLDFDEVEANEQRPTSSEV